MKLCKKCGTTKSFDNFHKDNSKRIGYGAHCKTCSAIVSKQRYEKNKDKILAQCRVARLKREYGIDVERYNKMLQSQGGKCAICGTESNYSDKNMCVDHNHTTGEVRGVLCNACNSALGHLRDSPEIVMNAYQYLIEKGHYGQERYEAV